MLGSLVTGDMLKNHVYAGVPAKDITEKIGNQFRETSLEFRKKYLSEKLYNFAKHNTINNIWDMVELVDNITDNHIRSKKIILDIKNREYVKKGSGLERRIIRYLLPDIKFVPFHNNRFKAL
jgi:predicted house-cleaning noncanonical NTP pyrophosphatase (MazG superfamily)